MLYLLEMEKKKTFKTRAAMLFFFSKVKVPQGNNFHLPYHRRQTLPLTFIILAKAILELQFKRQFRRADFSFCRVRFID